jgi:hypothetical protein
LIFINKPVLTGFSTFWAHVGTDRPINIDSPIIAMFLGEDIFVT